jgi:hypothetical protein
MNKSQNFYNNFEENSNSSIADFNNNNNHLNDINMNIDDRNQESEKIFPFNLSTKKNQSYIGEIKFRNYIPYDKNFEMERLNYFENILKVEKDYDKKVRRAIKEFINIEKNPLSIVPKKNNIDLKRNLGNKLSKLNRRTEIAILELISNKIKNYFYIFIFIF